MHLSNYQQVLPHPPVLHSNYNMTLNENKPRTCRKEQWNYTSVWLYVNRQLTDIFQLSVNEV